VFNETDVLPGALLEAEAQDLKKILGKPTLIHLEGENKKPLFVSTLLHGNETTGFYAIQKLLQQYNNTTLPRSISLFIANVKAAENNQRRLNTQMDYNRTWPGTKHEKGPEIELMAAITNTMQQRSLFASIDIHNNTGRNPHYACINVLHQSFLPLAGLFSKTVVYFTTPKGTQTACFANFCPAIVLECGQSGEADGIAHSYRFLETVINLNKLPSGNTEHINLFHTVARITIPEMFSFGIHEDVDICLYPHIENMNFHELDAGTAIARIGHGSHAYLEATFDHNNDVSKNFFALNNNEIILRKKATPSMFTTDTKAIQQDCLCYLMERININDITRETPDG